MTATMNGHAPIGADVLTREESIALSDCEDRIERGMKTFIEVGMALAAIQQNRLYRAQCDTFEEYCASRWNFTGRRGRQLIEAAEIGNMFPIENSRQAAALAAAPAAEREDVLREARERTGGKPTAKAISEVVKERAEPKPAPEPDLTPDVLTALATYGANGATAWQVAFRIKSDAPGPEVDAFAAPVAETLERLAETGRVNPLGRALQGNRMVPKWALAEPEPTPETPEPTADPSAAQVGPGPNPGSVGAVVDPPADPGIDAPTSREAVGADGCGCPITVELTANGSDVDGTERVEHRAGCWNAPDDSGASSPAPEPERHLSVVPDQPAPPPGSPATWTDEERAANQREIDRKRMVAAGRSAAQSLVMSVQTEIGLVVDAIDLGEKDLINAEMIAKLRRAVDLLESRLEASK